MAVEHPVVVVCASGSGVSYGLIHRIRATWGDAVRIVALDTNPAELVSSAILADEFVQVSSSAEPEFIDQLGAILKRWPCALVYPAVNSDFAALSAVRASGQWAGADFVLPADPHLVLATDKAELDVRLGAAGVPAPATFPIAELAVDGVPQDLFVKPRNGFGSRGARAVKRDDLLREAPEALEGMVVQELCEGPEVTVDAFFDEARGDLATTCRERLEIKAGVCTKARVFVDEELEAYARNIGELVGMRGSFCFQVMKAQGRWVVTDLNLRPGAGTAISCAVGADFFAAMHACRLGERGLDHIDRSLVQRGDCYVTRQYVEYITGAPQ